MADISKIEWCDSSWNPIAGCRKVSAGCDHCYAIRDAHRLAGAPHAPTAAAYAGLTMVQNGRLNWTGTFRALPDRLDQPLHWRRPRRVFVNSMSDLFGEGISESYLDRVFAVMALSPQHQFQVLTKRPERMLAYLNGHPPLRGDRPAGAAGSPQAAARHELVHRAYRDLAEEHWALLPALRRSQIVNDNLHWRPHFPWPLENVWLGTSVEDQRAADLRIPALLQTKASVRFLSCEPLLGPVDLLRIGPGYESHHDYLTGERLTSREKEGTPRLDWVIAGGESGREARPMHPDWVRSLRDQCQAAGVAFFFKQWGEFTPLPPSLPAASRYLVDEDTKRGTLMYRVGKKRAGRLLDGRQWDEFPSAGTIR